MWCLIAVTGAMVLFIIIGILLQDEYGAKEFISTVSFVLGICSFCVLIVMIGIAIMVNSGTKGRINSMAQERNSLVYQLENNLYDNDNDLGKKQLYDQITEWNKRIAKGRVLQCDPWVGVFWADIYDEFEIIEFGKEGDG